MGACKASIVGLLSSTPKPSSPKTLQRAAINGALKDFSAITSRRRLLLFSLPISSTFLILPIINQPGSCYALPDFNPVSPAERDASVALSERVSDAIELLEKGKELQAQGDFNHALEYFSQVVKEYKDFAFSDYARVGRALALYEIGDREEAIAELEDVSVSLKGYPEVHAALAAALYVDKNAPLLAENQFAIATILDPHYTDLSYVRETKHWPPRVVILLIVAVWITLINGSTSRKLHESSVYGTSTSGVKFTACSEKHPLPTNPTTQYCPRPPSSQSVGNESKAYDPCFGAQKIILRWEYMSIASVYGYGFAHELQWENRDMQLLATHSRWNLQLVTATLDFDDV
ncbi:hypothetical protein NE237_030465 [Protea cynaroides]|uniref:Uncharacterized protein n=1 Tax=Protea cynaroides TaxID=273540 RepID=A0A9Q0GW03_9MAGN|nr:hypothetical protein NE237_030465 [Protea cynaroides]